MKVVSLVPSWTETLMHWGVPIVGRTRFCIHPHEKVKNIPIIGGTKQQNWLKINELQPDILVADREENTRDILGRSAAHYHITHIEKVGDMEKELKAFIHLFDKKFPLPEVKENIEKDLLRWQEILKNPPKFAGWHDVPGVLQWVNKPTKPVKKVCYVIWKKPWMTVSKQTFIGSIFELLGMGDFIEEYSHKYPTFELEDHNDETLMLFSTEPYPFAREVESLKLLKSPSAIIDGEGFSWFGTRSLGFLEELSRG